MSDDQKETPPLTLSQRARLLAGDIEKHINADAMARNVTTSVLRKRDKRIADLREVITEMLDCSAGSQAHRNATNTARTLLEQPDD